MPPFEPITKCPKCGSEHLIEDDGIKCQDCDWEDENPEIDWDDEDETPKPSSP